MTEKVPAKGNSFATGFVVSALTLAGKQKLLHGKLSVTVTVLIEGEAVPFQAALAALEADIQEMVNQQALHKAQQLVSEAGLSGAVAAIKRANLSVQRALGEAYDKLRSADGYVERDS